MKDTDHPSSFGASRPITLALFILRSIADLNHLTPAIAATALADVMGAHQLAARLAGHERRRGEPLMLAPVAAAMARNFRFWYGTHDWFVAPYNLIW